MPLTEKSLIAHIRSHAPGSRTLRIGIGDDCAVLRPPRGHDLLVTTDFSLEGVHFRRDWHTPEVIGHRCLTRGISDIAAMGGDPLAVFLSLALPANTTQPWVDRFFHGLLALAKQFHVPLAGGDTAQSPSAILADIVVLGSAPEGRAILRSGAQPGDLLYVSGSLGAGAAALRPLYAGKRVSPKDYPRHFHPIPRIAIGRALRRRATAMIDLSDGLSTDLAHICEESRVGADLNAAAIPRAQVGDPARPADLHDALHGGDDYELLFTASPRTRIPKSIAGVPITQIGTITRSRKIVLVGLAADSARPRRSTLNPEGWEHFRSPSKKK
jgi:thiamine-monophosphate kinase